MSIKQSFLSLIMVACVAAGVSAQQAPPSQGPGGFADLIVGLKASPGCLGVETARTSSGKNVIFAWFESKQAVRTWYYSPVHQKVMRMGAGADYVAPEPMQGVPDNVGPVMVIASLTMSDKPVFKNFSMPISQIAIEIYQPTAGGIFLGSRFAPESLKVQGMKDFTPKQ